MKLVHYQIEHIEEYINSQGIWYDDVKAELLDHIICSVEERMLERGLAFKDVLADVLVEINVNKFQRTKLKYEHLNTYKEVFREMSGFLKGIKFFILTLLVTLAVFVCYQPMNSPVANLQVLSMGIVVFAMFYFIGLPAYDRKYRALYHCFYMSRVNAVTIPILITVSVFEGRLADWLMSTPLLATILYSFILLFIASATLVMNRTYKEVKQRAAFY